MVYVSQPTAKVYVWSRRVDEDLSGIDLDLDYNDSFVVTTLGDFQTISGEDLIAKALVRRLMTPPSGMRRWIKTPNGVTRIDENYGNEIFDYLSAPLNYTVLNEVHRAITDCVAQELRVEMDDLKITLVNVNTIDVEILYRIRPDEQLRTLKTQIVLPDAVRFLGGANDAL